MPDYHHGRAPAQREFPYDRSVAADRSPAAPGGLSFLARGPNLSSGRAARYTGWPVPSPTAPTPPAEPISFRAALRDELRPLLALAGPVIISELGWMAMGLVDTAMVGRVSAEAMGALSVGTHTYFVFAMFGMGVLLGLDPLVSQAWGAGRRDEAHRGLVQGVFLSVVLGAVLMSVLWAISGHLSLLGIDAAVLPDAIAYMDVVAWGVIPLLLFAAARRYLQGMGVVRPVMIVVLVANVVNVFANWALIFGHLGFPAMGAVGSAWATTVSRVFLLAGLFGFVWWHDRANGSGLLSVSWGPDLALLRYIVRLGLPAATQLVLEGGVFTAATLLAARLDPTALAAHQIALGAAAFAFMVPLAISSAGAVRVGQGLGAGEPVRAKAAGWVALFAGGSFMVLSALSFLTIPRLLLSVFTDELAVIAVGVGLLRIAAAFQLFDGVQVVATGILRGSGDTRTSMLTSVFAYWVLGLPLAWLFGFTLDYGVDGLWVGLTGGLVFAAFALVTAWVRRTRRLPELASSRPAS